MELKQKILIDPDFEKFGSVTLSNYWDGEDLASVIKLIPDIAKNNPNGKFNLRVHDELSEKTHGLLNLISPGVYFKEHKHEENDPKVDRREGEEVKYYRIYLD